MKGHKRDSMEKVVAGSPGDYFPIVNDDREVTALWCQLPTGSPARLPGIGHGSGGPEWTITLNENGTVTVDESIRQHAMASALPTVPEWHGYLRNGFWSEA